jgi:hypothetical protein
MIHSLKLRRLSSEFVAPDEVYIYEEMIAQPFYYNLLDGASQG